MKVPKYIKNEMHKVAHYAALVDSCMNVVEGWLGNHDIDPDQLRDGGGCGLEELEYGEDITEELCYRIESILKGKD